MVADCYAIMVLCCKHETGPQRNALRRQAHVLWAVVVAINLRFRSVVDPSACHAITGIKMNVTLDQPDADTCVSGSEEP